MFVILTFIVAVVVVVVLKVDGRKNEAILPTVLGLTLGR